MRERNEKQIGDAELEQAIGYFRQSVTAWSEAEAGRTRALPQPKSNRFPVWLTWSMAGTVAAACAVWVLMLAGGQHAGRHGAMQAAIAPKAAMPAATSTQAATPAREMAPAAASLDGTQTAAVATEGLRPDAAEAGRVQASSRREDEDEQLLAGIDSDIAQGTPRALAPMAGWMSDSANQ